MQSSILIKGVAYKLRMPVKEMIATEASIAPCTLASVFTPIKGSLNTSKALDLQGMELPTVEVLAKIMYGCMKAEYPEMTLDKVCDLLGDYFEEAHDMASAQIVLFMILGQATGFFNVAENPQSTMGKALKRSQASKKSSDSANN